MSENICECDRDAMMMCENCHEWSLTLEGPRPTKAQPTPTPAVKSQGATEPWQFNLHIEEEYSDSMIQTIGTVLPDAGIIHVIEYSAYDALDKRRWEIKDSADKWAARAAQAESKLTEALELVGLCTDVLEFYGRMSCTCKEHYLCPAHTALTRAKQKRSEWGK